MITTVYSALGALCAVVLLVFGNHPQWGSWALRVPLVLLYPLYYIRPVWGVSFVIIFVVGILGGRFLFGAYSSVWAWPEALVLLGLVGVPWAFRRLERSRQSRFERIHADLLAEQESIERTFNSLSRENKKIERQLRDIGHLYDVMRDAGSTLSVMEMLSLAREHTERNFRMPHFVMAMLATDGKRYEIRVSSGCRESQFRDFGIPIDPVLLASHLAKDRRALWVEDTSAQPEFSSVRDLGIRSFVFIPFIVHNQVIGFLCAYSGGEPLLDPEEFTNLQIFLNQIAIGLQKALLYEKVQKLSITDGLTHLYSHRHFRQRLDEELGLLQRYESHMALLILDIDHFKRYNDTFGHVAGDQVLKEVARILQQTCDPGYLTARYGGEEMVVMVPEADQKQGMELAEKIRQNIQDHVYQVGKESTRVTVSIGVASFPQDATTGTGLITQADRALYTAKAQGRNQVVGYYAGMTMPQKKIDTPLDGG
jgi:diguanylate cyclase (GGDEF)-like protein